MATQGQGAATHVHILFQSLGGSIGDGIYLYNLFRAVPFDLSLYNAGTLASIAAVAYFGAKHRYVTSSCSFMLHRSKYGHPLPAHSTELQDAAKALVIDDQRVEDILRRHVKLEPPLKWDDLKSNELWFTAEEPVRTGMADEIRDFAPPPRTVFYDFNFLQA